MAFRSFVTARCSIVPALETETPRTVASSALSRPAWNLSAISSRSASLGSRTGSSGGRVAAATASRRFAIQLVGGFAFLALVLSAIGI